MDIIYRGQYNYNVIYSSSSVRINANSGLPHKWTLAVTSTNYANKNLDSFWNQNRSIYQLRYP